MKFTMYLYMDIHGLIQMTEDEETARRRSLDHYVIKIEAEEEFVNKWSRINKEYSDLQIHLHNMWEEALK